MLTKNDLQAIKEVVDETIDTKLDVKLKPIKKDIKKIKKDVSVLIDHFDKRDLHLQKRVRRVEDHLRLPSLPRN